MNWHEYERDYWGQAYLNEFNGGWNQRWEIVGQEIECKGFKDKPVANLRLDVFGSSQENGAKVGVFRRTGNPNQAWTIIMAPKEEK